VSVVSSHARSHHSESRADTRYPVSVSAILPAYNEEAIIEDAVRHVAGVLAALVDDFQIVVTNDGSADQTGAVLASLRNDPSVRLHVVTHEHNRGYGAALASGFDAASKDLIFMTDGDKQFDVREIEGFLAAMRDDTDLVIGWRRHRADPPMRLLNAWGWKQFINGLFGYTARDVDCAFKLFRRDVWESVQVHALGATFSAELLIKARRLGFRVTELPVSHFPRITGRATGARPTVIFRAFRELFHLWRDLDRQLCTQHEPAAGSRRGALLG
jgi:glycosyltransferase involved in cell wall biosynthesis